MEKAGAIKTWLNASKETAWGLWMTGEAMLVVVLAVLVVATAEVVAQFLRGH